MKAGRKQSPPRWDRRQWILVLLLVFALEISLVYVLSWRPGSSIPATPRRTTLRFVTDPADAARFLDLPWLPEAAQFAQVTPRVFTAPVWHADPAFSPPQAGWREPPLWLEATNAVSPRRPGTFFLRAPLPWVVVAERPAPGSNLGLEQAPLVPGHTLLLVEGDLRQRPLLAVPELPALTVDDAPPPSVVQVVVSRLGNVISATLQPPGSGLPPADRQALELAMRCRFQPLRESEERLTWGRLIFRWGSRPPPPEAAATNLSPP